MVKGMKKAMVAALAAVLTIGSFSTAYAAKSPTGSVEAEKKDDVKADKVNGIVPTVDTKKDGTATLGSIKKTTKKSVSVPSKVEVNGVEYKVTKISAGAFDNCTKMTNVTIPSTVTTIGANAFSGADSLKKISLSGTKAVSVSKNAFKGTDTKKMTIEVSPKMSSKELKKLKKELKAAGYKGKVTVKKSTKK